jgi:hypothetical protein
MVSNGTVSSVVRIGNQRAGGEGMLATTEGLCTATKRFWRSAVWATVTAAVLLIGSAAWAQQQTAGDPNAPALRLIKLIPINGTAASPRTQMFSFDISWWDPTTGLFFLADRSNAALDVIDTTGSFTGTPDTLYGQIGGPAVGFAGDTGVAATSGPNGVTVAPNLPCIFATDTRNGGRVVSFNYNVSFTTVAGSVSTGGVARADELAFDPRDNVILAINNADTPAFGTLISVSSTCALSVTSRIVFNAANSVNATNGVEQPVWVGGSTQRFFVSVPQFDGVATRGGVLQITASGVVEGIYQVNSCGPGGLTSGPNGDLLVGCNSVFDTAGNVCTTVGTSPAAFVPARCTGIANPQEAICNPPRGCTPSNGSIVSVPGVGGGDEVWFNSGDNNYYVTGGNDPIAPVIGVIASGATSTPNTLTQVVPTLYAQQAVGTAGTSSFVHSAGTVHSIAASAANNHVYVALPANTAYQLNGVSCAQGCVAVFSAQ